MEQCSTTSEIRNIKKKTQSFKWLISNKKKTIKIDVFMMLKRYVNLENSFLLLIFNQCLNVRICTHNMCSKHITVEYERIISYPLRLFSILLTRIIF